MRYFSTLKQNFKSGSIKALQTKRKYLFYRHFQIQIVIAKLYHIIIIHMIKITQTPILSQLLEERVIFIYLERV